MTQNSEQDTTWSTQKLIIRSEQDRTSAHQALDAIQLPTIMSLEPPKANDELTARLHCAIRCIARQMEWAGEKLDEEDWKRLLVAGIHGQRIVPGVDGHRLVVLDRRTSRMSSVTKHELLDFVYAFGAERGVEFDDV